jgi:hypothetical protein
MSKDARLRAATAGACIVVVVAVVLMLAVDSRLDRQWPVRLAMLVLALLCVAVITARSRRSTRVIGATGIAIWGLAAPLTLTTSAASPEAKFAMAVHDDAKAAAARKAESAISVEEVTAVVTTRGGAVGRLSQGRITGGATEFPLVIRPDKNQPGPRICLSIEHGTDARIRRC